MVTSQPRIVEELNTALHRVMADTGAYLLGEDIADPYGGAFRATQGLSTAFPQRVLSTPISENAIFGVAAGLALSGETVIVEVMFGDFLALAFDQILNFITKSVSMYGRHTPMRVVVRCPVGGGRGYGPTHSQSMQKFFIGIPHLALYELTPFHDPYEILADLTARTEPSILFEDKLLYTERRHRNGRAGEHFQLGYLDDARNWARASAAGQSGPLVLLIATGGTARRALQAADELVSEDGLNVQVLVPSRLYPPELEPVLPLVELADSTWVVEESTAGGTWGAEIAARLHADAWHSLRQPVRLVHSADRVIPSAPHLERTVLLQPETIRDSVRAWRYAPHIAGVRAPEAAQPARTEAARSADAVPATAAAAVRAVVDPTPACGRGAVVDPTPACGRGISVPKLNSNDETYLLVEWLVEEGATVDTDDAVAVVETSKATEEIAADQAGVIRIRVPAGHECAPGETIAYVEDAQTGTSGADLTPVPEPEAALPAVRSPSASSGPGQAGTASDDQIPSAFSLIRVRVDAALDHISRLPPGVHPVGLTELVVRAIAGCREDFPLAFGTLSGRDKVHVSDGAHVAVTKGGTTGSTKGGTAGGIAGGTAGGGFRTIGDAEQHSLTDIAALLARPSADLAQETESPVPADGANIALAIHCQDDLLVVQEIIPPQLACIASLTGISRHIALSAEGEPFEQRWVGLGLSYDHRIINGRTADALLLRLKKLIEEPEAAAALSRGSV
jgi:pyruvate/2-oxoglutarate/acetoin dehydrogenase E1 component/pyruvate/2-oxoglutarate dehydrogenase complex dihydrolipoamide acyltransferase (E2) component